MPRTLVRPRLAARQSLGLIGLLSKMLAVRRQRNLLLRLDDHLLSDIGLTRDKAAREAQRPVWDVPPSWRR